MNLQDYRPQPDEGLYEKIQHRLRVRRLWRMGGIAAGVALVAAVTLLLTLSGKNSEAAGEDLALAKAEKAPAALQQPQQPAVQADEPEAPAATPAATPQPQKAEPQPAAEPQAPAVAALPLPQVAAPVAEAKEQPLPQAKPEPTKAVTPTKVPEKSEHSEHSEYSDYSEKSESPAATTESAKGVDPSNIPVHIDNLIWAPNVFAPDGDIDDNRRFQMRYSSSVTEFHLYIYNRGGRQVYTSNDPSFSWDGTHNGSRLPQGGYVWIAKFRDTSGRPRQEQGTVTLIR